MSEPTPETATTENAELAKRRELLKEEDQVGLIELNGRKLNIIRTRVKKGRGMGNRTYRLKFDEAQENPFLLLQLAVGTENWKFWLNRKIQEEVSDAAHDSMTESGEADSAVFPIKLLESFQRKTAETKVGIRALREKLESIVAELTVLLTRESQGQTLNQAELLRKGSLLLDMTKTHEAIEKKEVKGKKSA